MDQQANNEHGFFIYLKITKFLTFFVSPNKTEAPNGSFSWWDCRWEGLKSEARLMAQSRSNEWTALPSPAKRSVFPSYNSHFLIRKSHVCI
jgi:hypothetical protein